MNIPVHDDHTTLSFEPPTSKEGQYISLKAEVDLVIAFSACPQASELQIRDSWNCADIESPFRTS
jgi:uncharacterized protein YcgI (DUF1989 family)